MSLKIKAVLFDLVGTLIYVKDSVGVVYATVAKDFDIEADPFSLNKSFIEIIHKFPQMSCGEEEEKKWWRKIVYETFKQSGHEIDDNLDSIFIELYKVFSTKSVWAIFPEVITTLSELKGKNILLGLITNFDSRLEIILSELNLKNYFNCLSYSGKVGYSKPGPEIFKYALNSLNVLPEEAIYIGDNIKNDYYPSLNMNINTFLINRKNGGNDSLPEDIRIISNLKEIFEYL